MSNKGVIGNVNINGETYSIASTLAAICSTSASAQSKTASVVNCPSGNTPTFTLIDGITISVLFENANTAQNPTLNINNSGAKPIYKFNTTNSVTWGAGTTLNLTYFAASGKTGWWVNGEYKESEQVSELYKITVTGSNSSYSSDKDYEEILAAYTANKYIYVVYGSIILPLVSVNDQNTYSKFNFEVFDSTGYAHISIYGSDGHQAGEIDTDIDYEYIDLSYSPSFDDVSFKITATLSGTTWSVDKTYSQITAAYNTRKYIYLYYVNNDYDDCYLPLVAVDQVYHFESLGHYKYIHFEVYLGDNNTTNVYYEEIPLVTNVKIDNSSIISGTEANIITSSSHPYNASSNVLATMGDISAINVGATDVQVNGASILNSGVANLITNTAYNASSNKLATMSDISAATSGVGDVKINGVSILSGGEANIITHGAYNASSNKIATMSDLPGNFGADEIMYSTSLQEWSSIRPAGDPTDVEQALEALAQYTVDHDGTVTSITAGTGLTGGTITSSGTIALGTSGVTAGTYQGLTIDTYGRVTSASNQNYLTSYTETDPTVPAWAKASSKPTYTASEVGALSSTVPVNIGDSLYLRGTGLWRSTETANADRIITTVNSGKDLMLNADSTKTDANTGTIFLGYTNTTAVNIGKSSSDVALNYNGSAVFSNSYTSPSVYSSRCTITNGGYMQIGKWVIVNLYITIDATLSANTNSLLVYNLPEPEFSMSLSASTTAPNTVKGLNSFIRKHTTSGATKGEICICSTSGLASGNVVLISGIYTVS